MRFNGCGYNNPTTILSIHHPCWRCGNAMTLMQREDGWQDWMKRWVMIDITPDPEYLFYLYDPDHWCFHRTDDPAEVIQAFMEYQYG